MFASPFIDTNCNSDRLIEESQFLCDWLMRKRMKCIECTFRSLAVVRISRSHCTHDVHLTWPVVRRALSTWSPPVSASLPHNFHSSYKNQMFRFAKLSVFKLHSARLSVLSPWILLSSSPFQLLRNSEISSRLENPFVFVSAASLILSREYIGVVVPSELRLAITRLRL